MTEWKSAWFVLGGLCGIGLLVGDLVFGRALMWMLGQ